MRLVRIFFFSIIAIIGIQSLAAQELPTAHATSLKALEAGLQQGDFTLFSRFLSDEFVVGGYPASVADQVIPQLLAQYPPLNTLEVESFADAVASVELDFKDMGKQASQIGFDQDGKIKMISYMDEVLNASAAASSEPDITYVETLTCPFELVGGLIFVQVKLNGVDEWFILDSGAPVLVLNSAHFQSEGDMGEAQGVSGSTSMQALQIESFDWQGLSMGSSQVIGMDLTHLETETGKAFKGLIGFEMLRAYELYINYDKKELKLSAQEKPEWHSSVPTTIIDFELQAHIPVIKGTVAGKEYTFGLDTGAESNLIGLSAFDGIPSKCYKLRKEEELAGADKNVSTVKVIDLKESVFKGLKYKKMQCVASDISHLTDGYGLRIDGLLGFPFLSQFQTSIDFRNGKVYVWE